MASSSFAEVLDGLARNDPAAADRVAREAFVRLVGQVRRRLGGRLRAKVDPEEIANSVLKSFFHRNAAVPYALGGWEDLWALLSRVARDKVFNRVRYYTRQVRDVGKEAGAAAAEVNPERPVGPAEDEVAVADLVDHLTLGWTPAERAVIDLSLRGYTVDEVAAELGRAGRTVQRVRKRFRARLAAELGLDPGADE